MLRVGEDLSYAHPDLSDELHLVNREIRAGYSWDEALCNLSERTGVDDIKALVNALVQAGPLGVVMAVDAAPEDREVVADESQATSGEDRRGDWSNMHATVGYFWRKGI